MSYIKAEGTGIKLIINGKEREVFKPIEPLLLDRPHRIYNPHRVAVAKLGGVIPALTGEYVHEIIILPDDNILLGNKLSVPVDAITYRPKIKFQLFGVASPEGIRFHGNTLEIGHNSGYYYSSTLGETVYETAFYIQLVQENGEWVVRTTRFWGDQPLQDSITLLQDIEVIEDIFAFDRGWFDIPGLETVPHPDIQPEPAPTTIEIQNRLARRTD